MIEGFTTSDSRLCRNWNVRPSWWQVDVYIPRDTPLYFEAKRLAASFRCLRLPELAKPITDWLELNATKKYSVGPCWVRFQNEQDALMFFLTLR